MKKAVLFKVMHRKFKFRNPHQILGCPEYYSYSDEEYKDALAYIENLRRYDINYSHPESDDYPVQFRKMKEPPLFFEYYGKPLWKDHEFISVVGSREIHPITERWLRLHLSDFVKSEQVGIVSGGAKGVDQLSHVIAIKNDLPTIFVLPSGLLHLYPHSLEVFKSESQEKKICFISEFEINQKIHKSHFYFRNRLIAALGKITMVAQASTKSGSLLTVHHCLEMGRPVATVPAHPEMSGFDGNLKLLFEGAYLIRDFTDLHDFWKAESWPY